MQMDVTELIVTFSKFCKCAYKLHILLVLFEISEQQVSLRNHTWLS
jgi:hypothetical protein